jgi:hypothetical protein
MKIIDIVGPILTASVILAFLFVFIYESRRV